MLSLKIATINTWKCEGDYFERIKYMAEELKSLNLDIVLCQECFVCHEMGVGTLSYLAEQLEMYKNYVPARKKERFFEGKMVVSESGLGLLSKYAIVESSAFELPNVPGDDTRMLQKVGIQLPNGDVLEVINVHFTHIDTAENHRLHQIEFLKEKTKLSENLQIMGGDFNALPYSVEIQHLTVKEQFLDIFKFINADIERVSLADPFEKGVKLNVDYLFVLQKSVQNEQLEIVAVESILNRKNPINNEYASDHFGVLAEIKINN